MREELVGFLQVKKKTSEDKMRLKEKEVAARQEERARELDLAEKKEKRLKKEAKTAAKTQEATFALMKAVMKKSGIDIASPTPSSSSES